MNTRLLHFLPLFTVFTRFAHGIVTSSVGLCEWLNSGISNSSGDKTAVFFIMLHSRCFTLDEGNFPPDQENITLHGLVNFWCA